MAKGKVTSKFGLTPKELYDAYSSSDLLPIEPPAEGCTWEEFAKQIRAEPVGDTLFEFIVYELQDCLSSDEARLRLLHAVDDLQAVHDAIED